MVLTGSTPTASKAGFVNTPPPTPQIAPTTEAKMLTAKKDNICHNDPPLSVLSGSFFFVISWFFKLSRKNIGFGENGGICNTVQTGMKGISVRILQIVAGYSPVLFVKGLCDFFTRVIRSLFGFVCPIFIHMSSAGNKAGQVNGSGYGAAGFRVWRPYRFQMFPFP